MKAEPSQRVGPEEMLIRTWLFGRSANTASAYEADVRRFLAFVGKPISAVELADLQAWSASMEALSAATRARRLSAVKSLLTFADRMGYLPGNPGAALRFPRLQETTADRILSPVEVARMIGAETDPRRAALLRVLYVCGIRASEACGLRWRDMAGSEKKGGEAKVLGKGGKLRVVLVPADLWRELAALSPVIRPDGPVLPGRGGAPLDRSAVQRAVKRAARRAGVNGAASPHWLRHSSATHALNNGCPVHVVQQRLGHASLATTTRYLHVTRDQGMAEYLKLGSA